MSEDDSTTLLDIPANLYDWYIEYQVSPEFERELEEDALRRAGLSLDELNGFIYVIHCQPDFYKIGHAQDIEDRLKSLQTGCPYPLMLVHRIPCDDVRLAESCLHKRFKKKRVRGEWFKLRTDDVQTLKSLVLWREKAFFRRCTR